MTAKPATKAQRIRWEKIRLLGCIIHWCGRPALIHHCGTNAGGRKDHDKVIPLCHEHHARESHVGIHRMGHRAWEERFGTEEFHMDIVKELLGEI